MALEDYRGDAEMCCRCSACKFVPLQMVKGSEHSYVCPSIARYNFHSYSGGGRLNIANQMLKKGFDYSDTLLKIVYNCQMCGACDVSCKYAMDMEVIQPINEFRIRCVETGHTHPALDKVMNILRKQGTMVPGVSGKRGSWTQGLNIKDASREKVEVYYHAGCLTSFNMDYQKLARSTASLLAKTGVNFGIGYENETCCGGRAYQMGYREDFLNQAKKNMDMLKQAGVKTLVTGCADCFQAFNVVYDQYKLKGDLEVLHTTQYFGRLIKEKKLQPQKPVDISVTFHDPCHLGRLGEPWIHWQGKKKPGHRFIFDPPRQLRRGTYGVYEPPRDVLKSIPGLKIMEMDRIKEYCWCCGAGGGVNETNPEYSMWTAKERIKEAESTGAEAVVSACPWCEKNFTESIKEDGSELGVYDFVELLEKSI